MTRRSARRPPPQGGRGAVLRARARGPHARRRSFPAGPRPDQRGRRMGLARGFAQARLRHREHHRGREGIVRARRTPQPVHQDSRYSRGHPGDRRGDLRRRAGQRDAAVLARAVHRGRRSLHPRHRAPRRGRPQSARRFGRLGVRQPMGRRGREESAAGAARPARHRHRQTHLQGLSRAAGLRPLAAAGQLRRALAAAAVGQHRHQGSQGLRRALRQSAGGAAYGQHDAGEYSDGDCRPWRGWRDDAARRRQRGGGAGRVHQGRRRYRRAGRAASARRRRRVRQIMGRPAGLHHDKSAALKKAS